MNTLAGRKGHRGVRIRQTRGSGSPVPPGGAGLLLAVLLLAAPNLQRAGADVLVLRDLEILRDVTVRSFDLDGVRLASGRTLTWDQIERASVSPAQQAAFDQLLKDVGLPLYRLRQRLAAGDDQGLLPLAEPLYRRYQGRTSRSAWLVAAAMAHGLARHGRREDAVEPLMRCLALLRRLPQSDATFRPDPLPLGLDGQTGIASQLLPVWWDSQAAAATLPAVAEAIQQIPPPVPEGARVYYATLALTAGQTDQARGALAGLDSSSPWLLPLLLQQAVLNDSPLPRPLPDPRAMGPTPSGAVTLYWLGRYQLRHAGEDPQALRGAVLTLLRLPAAMGDRYPEVAAAALAEAARTLARLGDHEESLVLRRELLGRYGHTTAATRWRLQENQGPQGPSPQDLEPHKRN